MFSTIDTGRKKSAQEKEQREVKAEVKSTSSSLVKFRVEMEVDNDQSQVPLVWVPVPAKLCYEYPVFRFRHFKFNLHSMILTSLLVLYRHVKN